ncbi:MAG: hypothetical protein JST54_00140 [Deltaproteobacteria bacterium]|nr:hypothetical protein [Deltaproteobacteria bacterium]
MRRFVIALGTTTACVLVGCGSTCTQPSGDYTVSLAQDNNGSCGAATLIVVDGGSSLSVGALGKLCTAATTVTIQNPTALATATGPIVWSLDGSSGTGPMDYSLCQRGPSGEDAGCCHSPNAQATFERL